MFQRFRDKQFGEKYSWEVIANKRNGCPNHRSSVGTLSLRTVGTVLPEIQKSGTKRTRNWVKIVWMILWILGLGYTVSNVKSNFQAYLRSGLRGNFVVGKVFPSRKTPTTTVNVYSERIMH